MLIKYKNLQNGEYKMNEQNTVKGYKVFDPDWTCRGFQYQVGECYEID